MRHRDAKAPTGMQISKFKPLGDEVCRSDAVSADWIVRRPLGHSIALSPLAPPCEIHLQGDASTGP